MKKILILITSVLFLSFFISCNEKDGPAIIPPTPKPQYYNLSVRLQDYNACQSITLQNDGSWFIDCTGGFDTNFFLDIELDDEEKASGVEFSKYYVLEFEVKGATEVDNTPLIIFLGAFEWPNYCSDCKRFIPKCTEWTKVSCNLMEDVPNKAAKAPWTWIRMGFGANAHTPTFYIRNVRLYDPNWKQQ